MAKYCENCGAQWDDDVKICGSCGVPFEKPEWDKMLDDACGRKTGNAGTIIKALIILLLIAGIVASAWSLVSYLKSSKTADAAATALLRPSEQKEVSPQMDVVTPLCVVLDPGHQRSGDPNPEPIGPGAAETKARVTSGTTGRYTGMPEYELNLQIGLQLKEELESRGYRVVMTRETHDVNLSNQERAQIAAEADGDIFVRLHANGSDDPTAEGAMTICMTQYSPYNPELYSESLALSEAILDQLVDSTGCRREYVWETDTMSGVNWATIPVTIVEVGYMTNEKEDTKLATESYQHLVVLGIANGIDEYFNNVEMRADQSI